MSKCTTLILLLIFSISCAFSNPLNKALCDAAGAGNLTRVKELIEAGADIDNHDGGNGATPLHKAASDNRVEVIKYLLSLKDSSNIKAMVNAKMGYDITPLYQAASYQHAEATKLLLKAGASIEMKESDSQNTPLLAACWNGFLPGGIETVQLLLEAGADPNVRSKDKSTPLIFVARFGSVELCKLLLQYKADPTLKRNDGMNAFQIAIAAGHSEAAALLKKAIADYQQPPDTNQGNTANFINETEPNDSFRKAQNLDPLFKKIDNPAIQLLEKVNNKLSWVPCPYPSVSINGSGKKPADPNKPELKPIDYFDYYSFTAEQGIRGVFDIDRGIKTGKGSLDVIIVLFDGQGTPLGGNENLKDYSWYFGTDKGSEEDKKGQDSYFIWDFKKTGKYVLGLAKAGTQSDDSGFQPLAPLDEDGNYILNIAIEKHGESGSQVQTDSGDNQGINPDFQGGQCPYVYVFDGKDYVQDIEIIPNQSGKSLDHMSAIFLKNPVIIGNKLVIQIREIKDEVSYLDLISITAGGRTIAPQSCPAELKQADSRYLILEKGGSITLTFIIPEVVDGDIAINAKGYYLVK